MKNAEKLNYDHSEDHMLSKAFKARNRFSEQRSPPITHDARAKDSDSGGLPNGHPTVATDGLGVSRCPYAQASTQESKVSKSKTTHTQDASSEPSFTPREASSHLEAPSSKQDALDKSSPPPSVTGSFAKCPIRLLDERPPEEIAEYFETHKHEIPRSHEICVKRYQSNAQSIRLLDAKYGNLVNMIQGLGIKHQPLLPTSDGNKAEKGPATKSETNNSLGDWANSIANEPAKQPSEVAQSETEEREGHFERPLREIRVGESPTRPWGIRVPDVEPAPSANIPNNADIVSDRLEHLTPKDGGRAETLRNDPSPRSNPRSAQMVFTGPVFIGYTPEREAELLRQFRPPK